MFYKYAGFALLAVFLIASVALMQQFHNAGCSKCTNAMQALQQHRGTIHTSAWDMIGSNMG